MMLTLTDVALVLNVITLTTLPMYLKVAWDLMSRLDKQVPPAKGYTDVLQHLENEVGEWQVQQLLEKEVKLLTDTLEKEDVSDSDPDSDEDEELEASQE